MKPAYDVAGIFMPAYVHSIWRFRTPMWSVNAPTTPPSVLVKSNGTGETASFISINPLFRSSL
ncbi:hypothetical protein [Bacteroides sp.]|uniref:hypothetical protein n=1 Tax=Bacteroides sp. TaxID=29523 RepID=UPI0026077E41|nr:hypothetical protein [Bacteroides sp.]